MGRASIMACIMAVAGILMLKSCTHLATVTQSQSSRHVFDPRRNPASRLQYACGVPKQRKAPMVLKDAPAAACMHPLCISFISGAKLEHKVFFEPASQRGALMCPAYTGYDDDWGLVLVHLRLIGCNSRAFPALVPLSVVVKSAHPTTEVHMYICWTAKSDNALLLCLYQPL